MTDLIAWINDDDPFPPVSRAMRSPNGLLAAGGDLSVSRLLTAYRHGIFPWFNPGEPIIWWSPDPRMALIPNEFKISRSLSKLLRSNAFEVRFDSAFEQVMRACAAPRYGQQGTWISEEMIAAYCELHRLGYAHSVEVWANKESFQFHLEGQAKQRQTNATNSTDNTARCEQGNQHNPTDEMELVGGVYGVSIGRMFYGESMFSKRSNTSKIALAYLARQLERWQFGIIDCQMHTPHLATLGAREIPRSEFIAQLQKLVHCKPITNWQLDEGIFNAQLFDTKTS